MRLSELIEKKGDLEIDLEGDTVKLKDMPWPSHGDQYWYVGGHVEPISTYSWHGDQIDQGLKNNHNIFRTREAAEKAAMLILRSKAIISACLEVDPDFEPDWTNIDQKKWSVYYGHIFGRWTETPAVINYEPAHVSSQEKAEEVARLLNDWGVK